MIIITMMHQDVFDKAMIRLCHDLINPIGAALMCLEEVDHQLAAQALDQAVKLLKLVRAASSEHMQQIDILLAPYNIKISKDSDWNKVILLLAVWIYQKQATAVICATDHALTVQISNITLSGYDLDVLNNNKSYRQEVNYNSVYLALAIANISTSYTAGQSSMQLILNRSQDSQRINSAEFYVNSSIL